MLKGEKHLSLFYDVLHENFINNEEIIPEQEFLPYVQNRTFSRHQKDILHRSQNMTVRYVCFTSKNNEWRAYDFFREHEECLSGKKPFDAQYEFFVGRLLGYSDEDIRHYISQFNF